MQPDDDEPVAQLDDEFSYTQEHEGPKWKARQFVRQSSTTLADLAPDEPDDVRETWPERFQFYEESASGAGLRAPQAGAVHSLLGYWSTDPRIPATIVMPTGTGKTDTMVAAMMAIRAERLLVAVPSDALRDQLSLKFERLGVLPSIGLVDDATRMPVVGKLSGSLQSAADADRLASLTNVVVTTMSSLTHTKPDVPRPTSPGRGKRATKDGHTASWRQISRPNWQTSSRRCC